VIYGSENGGSPDAWRAVALNDYVGGQFLWTGVDYLGEADRYPNHGSSAGLLDIQGFRKRNSYLRQALWSDKPMVYAAAWGAGADGVAHGRVAEESGQNPGGGERWGWTNDHEGTSRSRFYTNCDSVELVLNGRLWVRSKSSNRLLPALVWGRARNEAGAVEIVGRGPGLPPLAFN